MGGRSMIPYGPPFGWQTPDDDPATLTSWVSNREPAGDAASVAAWDVAWNAARALVVRDLLEQEHYDTLTRPWREMIGPIHPDDDEDGVKTSACPTAAGFDGRDLP